MTLKERLLTMPIFRWLVGSYHFTSLRDEVTGGGNVLELGCGTRSYFRDISPKMRIEGVDLFEPSARAAEKSGEYDKVHIMSVLDIGEKFPEKSFDYVAGFDVIEHVEKDDGFALMRMAEKIARKKVIFYTPNGFFPQGAEGGNEYQRHRSGWTVEEMQLRGYRVTGYHGFKIFSPKEFGVERRPALLWKGLRVLSHILWTRWHPKHAFQILCIKDIV